MRGPVLAAGATYAFAITMVEATRYCWGSAATFPPGAAALLFAMSMAAVLASLRVDPALFGTSREVADDLSATEPA